MSMLTGIPTAVSALPSVIPSPTVGVWHLGPIPIRGYAMCILAGIIVAVWLTAKRLTARGYRPGVTIDVSAWAVPFGILGGRLYHLITTPQPYFGKGGDPWKAFAIYEGGLGIWGAIALGALGAWIGCRRHQVLFRDFVDAAAPGIAIAQAMGRFGNWFNNEIYGAPTNLPWGLRIYEWDTSAGRAVVDASGNPIVKGYFQPTFLYEALWCLLLAGFLIWLGRRYSLKPGQIFAAYVMGYPVGRIVIENMRSDEANLILGQRVNTWVSILVFLLGLYLWRHFGRMPVPERPDAPDSGAEAAGDDTDIESSTEQPQAAPVDGDPAPDADSDDSVTPSAGGPETASSGKPATASSGKAATASSSDEDPSAASAGHEPNAAAAGSGTKERPSAP